MCFQAISRLQVHKLFVKPLEDIQKIGEFHPTYTATDPEQNVRTYGKKSKWDGHMKEKAKKLKDDAFWKNNNVCERIHRSLAKERDRYFTMSTQPVLPNTFKKQQSNFKRLPSHILDDSEDDSVGFRS